MASESSPISIALIGYGYWGPNLLRNLLTHPLVKVTWVADVSQENVQKASSVTPDSVRCTQRVEDIFQDSETQAVFLAVPTQFHHQLALQALQAGKHVFVEKPFTATIEEAEELVEVADQQQLVLRVDHPFVFSEPIRFIKSFIETGELGELYYLDSSRMNMGQLQSHINVVEDLIPHDLSIIDFLLGGETPMRSSVEAAQYVGQQEEVAHVTLHYSSGFMANIHLSWLSPVKVRQIVIVGSKKMIMFDDTQPDEKIRIYDKGVQLDRSEHTPFKPFYRSGDIVIPKLSQTETLYTVIDSFVSSVQDGKYQAINDGQAGLRSVRLLKELAATTIAQ